MIFIVLYANFWRILAVFGAFVSFCVISPFPDFLPENRGLRRLFYAVNVLRFAGFLRFFANLRFCGHFFIIFALFYLLT